MTQKANFISVALPKEIIEKIDDIVKKSNHLYLNRPHVIKIALDKFFNKNNGNAKNK